MNKSRILGWSVLAFIIYSTIGAAVYFVSLLALQKGVLLEVPWLTSTQKALYRAGMGGPVNNWLGQATCISPDPDLIYVPSNGPCKFDDIEFKTTLNFSDAGRNTGPKPAGTGIAVIGDSHAMGWGVNDDETFSAHLQTLTKRPVYNLGVASYGTVRELIRLEKSGVLDRVDTIIIQYCNNDLNENRQFDSASRQELSEKIFGKNNAVATQQPGKFEQIAKGYGLSLAAPFRSLADRLRRKNFAPHYEAFISIAQKHQASLAGKRVLVFYSNPYGQKYRNFPSGQDARLPNVQFVDLDLDHSIYRKLDNHLTPDGHRVAAERLFKHLQPLP